MALKVLRSVEPATLYRFKREFRALADVKHPGLVELYELFQTSDSEWFFSMEYVQGQELTQYLDAAQLELSGDGATIDFSDETVDVGETVDHEKIRGVFSQLAGGVHALHQAGLVHRDLKPSNVLVDTRSGRVRVLDFGLITGFELEEASLALAGTPAYMAPEQAGGDAVTPESDWYAVGVMLFEALTGELPFSDHPMALMMKKQTEAAPDPRSVRTGLDGELCALCSELLSIQPELRPSGLECLRRLGGAVLVDVAASTGSLPFCGREVELEALWERFREVSQEPVWVQVEAPAGAGKTRLVEGFFEELRREEPDCVVLRGRCFEQEWVPFKAFDGLMDHLSRHLEHLSPADAALVMPRDMAALVRLFPVLGRVSLVRKAMGRVQVAEDAQGLRKRAGEALRELLERMLVRQPVVLFFDDLHWGDRDSAELFDILLRRPEPPALMVLSTARDDSESPLIRQLEVLETSSGHVLTRHTLELSGLPMEQATELLGDLAEELSESALKRILEESHGHPMLLQELARAGSSLSSHAPRSLMHILWNRVSQLEAASREVLELLAVAGRPLSLAVLRAACGVSAEALEEVLRTLSLEFLVRREAARGQVCFHHDRLRESIEKYQDPQLLIARHLQLAEALEAQEDAGDPEALSRHFFAAGDTERASTYALAAAQRAFEACAFEHAAALFERALEHPHLDAEIRTRSLESLARALLLDGRAAEAAEHFVAAAEGRSTADVLRLKQEAALALLLCGRLQEGVSQLKDLAHLLQIRWPSRWRRMWDPMWVMLNAWRSSRLTERLLQGNAESTPEVRMRLDAELALFSGFVQYDAMVALCFFRIFVRDALRYGSHEHGFKAAANLAINASVVGANTSAQRILSRLSEELRRRPELDESVGDWLHYALGMSATFEMRFVDALPELQAVLDRYEETGARDVSVRSGALVHALLCRLVLGDWGTLGALLPAALAEARGHGDDMSWIVLRLMIQPSVDMALDDVEHADRRVDEAIALAEERSGGRLLQPRFYKLAFGSLLKVYQGRPQEAWDELVALEGAARRDKQLRHRMGRVCWYASKTQIALTLASQGTASEARAWMREAKKSRKKLGKSQGLLAEGYVSAFDAVFAHVEGRREEAEAHWTQSIQHFDAGSMRLLAAAARVQLARLRGEALDDALDEVKACGVRKPEKLVTVLFPMPASHAVPARA